MIKRRTKTLTKIASIIILSVCAIFIINKIDYDKCEKSPYYIVEILEETKSQLHKISNNNTISFSFITDIHINNEENSENNLNAFSEITNDNLIEFGVVGGDLYSAYETNHKQGIDYIRYVYGRLDAKTNKKVYFTKGNHDCNAKLEKSEYISNQEYYEITTKDIESDIITNPSDEFGCYYYKDFEDEKIRLCVLNSFEGEGQQFILNEKELEFVANDMLNFEAKEDSSEWQVLFVSHTANVEDIEKFNEIVNAYQLGEKVEFNGNKIDYSSQGKGTVIAFIAGHAHKDDYNYDNGYLNIIVQRGFNTLEEKNTKNEICFSIFTIDSEKHILYETRCGRGENRQWGYGEKKKFLNEAA